MATAASDTLDASVAYRLNIAELVAQLATDEHRGLSEAEARSRLTQYGPNELAAEKRIRAVSTDILHVPARVLVTQAARGCSGTANGQRL
jgi:magnesium-transporting ATPase (P-type)